MSRTGPALVLACAGPTSTTDRARDNVGGDPADGWSSAAAVVRTVADLW